jgi:DNA repair protein RadC
MSTLFHYNGTGYTEATPDEILEAARQVMARRFRRGKQLQSPQATHQYLLHTFAHCEYEVFTVIFLDNRNRLLATDEMFRGTIDGASVHPREVVKQALQHNAAAVILAHNHPSGIAEPSQADQFITRRLREALALVDIRVLDHVIVGGTTALSFAERGLL